MSKTSNAVAGVWITSEILAARKRRGMTQKQLEERSDVKQPVIARLENGTTDPQLSTLLKVLNSLDMTLAIVPLENH